MPSNTERPSQPAPPGDDGGLIFAFILDGRGGGREIGWDEVRAWRPDAPGGAETDGAGTLWVHLDRTGEKATRWLNEESGIDPVMVETLLQADSRPRVLVLGDELLLYLRGVNLNPGADPDDMVGIALWIGARRIISIRQRRVMAATDLRELLRQGRGPTDAGSLLEAVAERLMERMGPVIVELDDQVDALEEDVLTGKASELRGRLADLRREAIALRRYLSPQRDVMARLPLEPVTWLSQRQRSQLREIADRTLRMVEDLDSARERATVTQDELNSRVSDQMNRTMYVLTVVAAILLPPSFLTGLFGVNVAGMPGIESPYGFVVLFLVIVAIGLFEYWLLRKLKWI